MASGPTPVDAKIRFEAALKELNFGRRCNLLSALGGELRSATLAPAALEALLDGLLGTADSGAGGAEAFGEHARLLVAKAAGCIGYGRKLLDHPSQAVRFEAVRGQGLLKPEDAKAAFLSPNSSAKLKKFLVKCPALPCDAEVVEHAWQLFAERDKDVMWEVMVRIQDQTLFEKWLAEKSNHEMNGWVDSNFGRLKGLPGLAKRFPEVIISLIRHDIIVWSWYFAKDILVSNPAMMLRAVSLEGACDGKGPRKGYRPDARKQDFQNTIYGWGWRRQPEIMLEIIKECTSGATSTSWDGRHHVKRMTGCLMTVTSTRHYLTTNQKISYLLQSWALLPNEVKDSDQHQMAQHFVELLPRGCEKRVAELQTVIDAFWKIVDDVGRITRRKLLVGAEENPTGATGFFTTYAQRKLPCPPAIDQFFRILQEYEAGRDAYSFMQSNICKTEDGKYDSLMKRVFERYLQKDGENAVLVVQMFTRLLNDAKSQDVIQHAFDLLLKKLDHKMDLVLLRQVVRRMGVLDAQSLDVDSKTPKATLPVPTEWVHLFDVPKQAAPHIDFLFTVLHSGTGESDLLGAMLANYGRRFFWDSFDHVLSTSGPSKMLEGLPAPNLKAFEKVDVVSFAQVQSKQLTKSKSTELAGTSAFNEYFSSIGEAKKKVNSKEPCARNEGYSAVIRLASNSKDASKPFEDLLPYLTQRFHAEQETCREHLLGELFNKPSLPVSMWEETLAHLRNLWKSSSKARESSKYEGVWKEVGKKILKRCLRGWCAGQGPSEICTFGMEVAAGSLDLPQMLIDATKPATTPDEVGESRLEGEALTSAACWVLQTSVPLSSDIGLPLSSFWDVLRKFSKLEENNGSERALWQRWSFVREWWSSLLAQGSKQKSAEFVFTGVVNLLVSRQRAFAITLSGSDPCPPWWAPLECEEYKAAVAGILQQIESGEIPGKEGSAMLVRRIESLKKVTGFQVLKIKKRIARQGYIVFSSRRTVRVEESAVDLANACREGELKAQAWVKGQNWDIPQHHRYNPVAFRSYRVHDSIATLEVQALAKVLAGGQSSRQVLWQIVDVSAVLSGPEISKLVSSAIAGLDPKFEGMVRCIARHYPYLNCALTKGEQQQGSSDVLTPLVELWLLDDDTRDVRVAQLMERSDCEYFLFFGKNFARHLSNARQEWLHKCLDKLRGQGGSTVEFFHYARRGPALRELAQLGIGNSGWRRSLRTAADEEVTNKVQMYLWHPDTQTQFLEKALHATDLCSLSLVTRAAWANAVAKVSSILDMYPREQSRRDAVDEWGWEVIQAAGAYNDIAVEVQRRFQELPAPAVVDVVDNQQVEALLTALGRSDDATKSLKLLGNYAGKVKQAKEAVTKMIKQVSPPQARELIRDVMLPKKAGVGWQVAGLKKISELQIPNPLELYRKAWNDGHCQRDIAGNVLAQVATASDLSPEDVKSFFGFFDLPDKEDLQAYVADFLLDQLMESKEWTLPFLPGVIAKLAVLPGVTNKAMSALRANTSHPTEVLKALTQVMQTARLAARSESSVKDGPDSQLFKDLRSLTSVSTVRSCLNDLTKMDLDGSDSAVLLAFFAEMLKSWENLEEEQPKEKRGQSESVTLLQSLLAIWSKLLRKGQVSTWAEAFVGIYQRLLVIGGPYSLSTLAAVVRDRVLSLGPQVQSDEYNQMLAVVGEFFSSFFSSGVLSLSAPPAAFGVDARFVANERDKLTHGTNILLRWAALLANGCLESETDALFALCPEKSEITLAETLVNAAVSMETLLSSGRRGPRTQRRSDAGWAHSGGILATDVVVGSQVSGVVTNSSKQYGVFLDFGCVKDGKLSVPEGDCKNYRVGDEVSNCIVNKVEVSGKTGSYFIELLLAPGGGGAKAGSAGVSGRAVARRAVRWLAKPPELRKERWATLTKLLSDVLILEDGSFFEDDLALLGEPVPQPTELVELIEQVLAGSSPRSLERVALRWLGQRCTREAVRLWPALLTQTAGNKDEEAAEMMDDVEALLTLCKEHDLHLPQLKDLVAQGLPEEVVRMLASSELVEARLTAVQALQQRQHTHGQPPALLQELKADSCHIVRASAAMLWKALGGPEEKAENEEDDEDEDQA